MSEKNIDYIIEKLSISKMGKSAMKTYRNEIKKLEDVIRYPSGAWNNRVDYIFRSDFGLFKSRYTSFPTIVTVNFADMGPVVKYDASSGMFVFGVKPDDFNFYSTIRVRDETNLIRRDMIGCFSTVINTWDNEKKLIVKDRGLYNWDDPSFDKFDKNTYAENFLRDNFFTEDMMKMIKNLYPTYYEYYYFMEHLSRPGVLADSRLKDARISSEEVYKAIGDMVFDFITHRFLTMKVKDGYFKGIDTKDLIPLFAVDFESNVLVSNYAFRKTGLGAVKAKISSEGLPRNYYYLSTVTSYVGFQVDYSGIEPDLLWPSDFESVNLRYR